MNKPLFNKAIKPAILEAFRKAREEINIAVAWITDHEIIEALRQKSKEGVDVKLILSAEGNHQVAKTIEFGSEGKICVYILDRKGRSMMHHKFCVIDRRLVITGSYNYTHNAIHNDENVLIVEDEKVALTYTEEYRRLLDYFHFRPELPQQEAHRSYVKNIGANQIDPWIKMQILGTFPVSDFGTFTSKKGETYFTFNGYLVAANMEKILKKELVTVTLCECIKDHKNAKAGDSWLVAE
jgi:phosphatidylserine/phosphatidylglycerophosphate/cardiolipin synthase-like enzyme